MARPRRSKKKSTRATARVWQKHDVYFAARQRTRSPGYAFVPKEKRQRAGFIEGTVVRRPVKATIYDKNVGERKQLNSRWIGPYIGYQPKKRIEDCIRRRKKARRAYFGFIASGRGGTAPVKRMERAKREGLDVREGLEHEDRFTVRC
jgi:hypothetical protein